MPECGSQIILCDLPIRFDTYEGCSHGCTYCFARKKADISNIKPHEGAVALQNFINGKRTTKTNWCDWDIPLHWGGMSDPFQPAEKHYKRSYDCLKIFAETGYPFAFSTKGYISVDSEYLNMFSKCNAVAQVSMVTPKYDKLEPGAPTFKERIVMLEKLAKVSKRLIVRISPYSVGLAVETASYMSTYKDAGVFGVEIEGMKRRKKTKGWVKVGGDICYPVDSLRRDFEIIRESARGNGLAFYVGENRLRNMGDSTCCCGVDGVSGFYTNKSNINAFLKSGRIEYRSHMESSDTAMVFLDAALQDTKSYRNLKGRSYKDVMEVARNTKCFLEAMGADITSDKPELLTD